MTVLTLLNPAGWMTWYRAKLSGGAQPGQATDYRDGYIGKPVTPDAAMALTAYWACVRLISSTIGTLPMELFALSPDGSGTPDRANPLFDLLRDQPNADQTGVEFWEGVGACLCVWGNAYALKTVSGGNVVALDLLRPYWMEVFRAADGSPVYRYTDPLLGRTDYGPEDIFHVRGFGFGDLVGLSPTAFNATTIRTALAVDEMAESMFRNGMRISGWFRYKGAGGFLKPEQLQQAKDALVHPHSGPGNAGRAGVLPSDFDWQSTAMSSADAQLIENRRMSVEDVCRVFGVPPIMIGHAGPGQTMWGSGVETITLGFLTTTLRPYLHRIEAAIGRDIIGREGRKRYRAAFNTEELVRGDSKGRAETAASHANNGVRTRNEIRKDYGLPPMPGGDVLTVQTALIPIDMLGEIAKLPRDKPVEPGADVAPSPQQEAA